MYASVGLLLVISGIFTVTGNRTFYQMFKVKVTPCTISLHVSLLRAFLGGLTAVIWTDFIQTIIMLAGAIYLMVVGGHFSFNLIILLVQLVQLTIHLYKQNFGTLSDYILQ